MNPPLSTSSSSDSPDPYPHGGHEVKDGLRGACGRHVIIFINGILARPGDAEGWTDRAVTWTHLHTGFRGEKLEYFSGVLTRRLFQQARAAKYARMVRRYLTAGYTVSLVGHSNGCDLALRIAALVGEAGGALRHLHLVAAAAEADFDENGLNFLLHDGTVRRVQVYVSRADRALRFAQSTARPLNALRLLGLNLGYGSLGLTGPLAGTVQHASRVSVIDRPGYGHGTWFADSESAAPAINPRHTPFESTMRLIADFEIFHAADSNPSEFNK